MAVTAPSQDTAGALLDAQIATLQALVLANGNPRVEYQLQQLLNQLQVKAVDHYMVTGWLNAATILVTYSAPAWDRAGQTLATRVAFLTTLAANAPTPPVGNVEGYGGGGWVTVAQNYQAQLYAAQIALVEHIMDVPGGTTAAAILANLSGFQSFSFEYSFTSVGFTDEWIDD